jgi:Tol biopolymer transport system component/tRNA A-37 threonylcarbamoyl transferase component Bud32
MVGKQFGRYLVLEQAGAGGMGVVYRARDEQLQRDVALKLPVEGACLTGEVRAKWLAEARAASALNHPNICTIYEVGERDGEPYIAMEYLSGATLSERIPEGGMPAETVLDYGAQVASALEHAHTHGVVHRDLKTANVRLSGDGQVKVLDFGLAVSVKDSEVEGATQTSESDWSGAPGTLAYLAPEVLDGTAQDTRSDIWGLGAVLYEMASGKHPFRGRTTYDLTMKIMREPPRALPTHVPPGLRAIILRCLAKEPEKRYQRASEVKAALEALHSNGGAVAAVAGPFDDPEQIVGRFTRRYLWLGAGLVAVVAAVIYFVPGAKPRVSSPEPGGKLRLLFSTEGNIEGPAISSDGKMLAYVEEGEKSDDLYVTRVVGGERVTLTNDVSQKGEPSFSPDGEKIAFSRKVAGETANEVCMIAAFGGEVVPVARGGSMPTWSPDGMRLTFVLRKPGEPEALAIASLDGLEMRTILAGDAIYPFLGRPEWSPDGKTIAVARSRGGDSREIWLVPVNGENATQLTHGSAGVSSDSPVFSGDGRGLVYPSNRGGAWNLWYEDLSGRGARQLTTGPGPDSTPSVARDGSIAFLNSRTRYVLVLYELATQQSKTILSDSAIFWAPVFSPDDTEVTYSRGEPDGSWHLWTVPAGGGTPRQLTSGKVPEIYGRYTPDGSEIFYSTWGPEPLSIGRVPRKGGLTRVLSGKTTTSDSYADISPDGKWVVFARTENKVAHVYVRLADGTGEARRVTANPGTVPRWSPDGKWIVFSPDRGFDGGAYVVHPDGSGLKRVAARGGWPVWWPGGEKIGLQAMGADGHEEYTVVTIASGEMKALPGLHFSGTNYPFDVSRDGKWLVTTNSQHISDEIWLLEKEKH